MTSEKMVLNVEFDKASATGKRKQHNEDAAGHYLPEDPEELQLRGQMFIIADGRGEDQQGAIVSKLAITTVIHEYFMSSWVGTVKQMLLNAVYKANEKIYKENLARGTESFFSCSLACAVIHENILYVAYVGNCCVYLLSNAHLEKLTPQIVSNTQQDDSFDQIHGDETADEYSARLGVNDDVKVNIIQRQVHSKDVFLLCTSGIYNSIVEYDIQKIIETMPPSQACKALIDKAAENEAEDDATAVMIRLKSIKRLVDDGVADTFEEEEMEPPQHVERNITIKGVRYRSSWKNGQEELADRESLDEFSQDRDVRRPIFKRNASSAKSGFPFGKFLSIFIIILLISALGFLIFKYVPIYWQKLKTPASVPHIFSVDSLKQQQPSAADTLSAGKDTVQAPVIEPEVEQAVDTTEIVDVVEPEPEVSLESPLRIALVDGYARQRLQLGDFIADMKTFSTTSDRFTQVKSSYKIKNSKIIWRRTSDALKEETINERVDQIRKLFIRYFRKNPEILPLDFTLVIGADFKMPAISDKYSGSLDQENDYYMEILNGYKVAGLARKLGNQLHNQRFDKKRLLIIDYRNADNQKYMKSFIKCDPLLSDVAKQMANAFKLPQTIVYSPLFDIKIIIGSDITL